MYCCWYMVYLGVINMLEKQGLKLASMHNFYALSLFQINFRKHAQLLFKLAFKLAQLLFKLAFELAQLLFQLEYLLSAEKNREKKGTLKPQNSVS